ncbi:hypothetical protein G6F57_017287 [Rhizopus arrhizus]|nr:hypothetical protein G6F57_017287 [Rhizopus arrhizus]
MGHERATLPLARGGLDGRGSRLFLADGRWHEAAVGQLSDPGSDLPARRGLIAIRAGLGAGQRRPAVAGTATLGPAPAAWRAGHGDDRLLRVRPARPAAVHRLHHLFRRPAADRRTVGAAAGRTGRAAALGRHRHRPGRRAGGAAAGRGRLHFGAGVDGAGRGHRLRRGGDHGQPADPHRHLAVDGGLVPGDHGRWRRPAGPARLGAAAIGARAVDRRHGPGRGVGPDRPDQGLPAGRSLDDRAAGVQRAGLGDRLGSGLLGPAAGRLHLGGRGDYCRFRPVPAAP